MTTSHFSMLAAYNQWANKRLYDAVSTVPDDEYRADRGAFFRSLHGTLNHLLVTDRIWMRRFTGQGEAPVRLDAILFEDFSDLRAARDAEDNRIIGWVDSLTEEDLAGVLRYRSVTSPAEITQPLAPALVHLFNHQTHHRGQAHALLSRYGGNEFSPSFDLIVFQRQTGIGIT